MQYNLVGREGMKNLVVVVDGDMYVADEQHPLFDTLVAKAVAGDESVVNDFDASVAAATKFENLSERVSVANGRVYFDGDELDDVYADQIIEFLEADVEDWKPLVKFYEKALSNIEAHTRENLARWIESVKAHDGSGLTINDDGDIVGYKGVTADLKSIRSGPGIVNGEVVDGHLDNSPGNVVEMQRSKVEHNPQVGCSVGLHVGTWEYAKGFSQGPVLEVTVNPRDVVSVPTDCGGQKMRVARYKVVQVLDNPYNTPVRPVEDFYDEDDYADYDDDYDWAEFPNDGYSY
jgi:hypothetical protein